MLKIKIFLIALFVSLLFIASSSHAQTYIYDPNLKLNNNNFLQLCLFDRFETKSPSEIEDDFNSNEIRAKHNYRQNLIIIKGEISFIKNINGLDVIGFEVNSNSLIPKYIVVHIFKEQRISNCTFDNIKNYSVGNYVDIVAQFNNHTEFVTGFSGNILHSRYIYAKNNYLVKFINLPEDTIVNVGEIDGNRFSPTLNGKCYKKFLGTSEFVSIDIVFKDKFGDVIRRRTIKAKINCHSIFDYSKM